MELLGIGMFLIGTSFGCLLTDAIWRDRVKQTTMKVMCEEMKKLAGGK